MNVLIVEDSLANRRLLGRIMACYGFQVTEAENAASAMHLLQSTTVFGLAIIDFAMPYTDGLHLARWIRARPGIEKLPILMISGHASAELEAQAVKVGVNEFQAKPFDHFMIEERLAMMEIGTKAREAPKELSEEEKIIAELRAMGIDTSSYQ